MVHPQAELLQCSASEFNGGLGMQIRGWKFIVLGAAFGISMIVAGTQLNSYASVNSVSQQSAKVEQLAAIETNAIIGSDASTSAYGVDPMRTVDW